MTRIFLTTREGAGRAPIYRGVPPALELDVLLGEEAVLELLFPELLALGEPEELLPFDVLGLVAFDVDFLEELLAPEPAFACLIERELEFAVLGLGLEVLELFGLVVLF